MSKIFDSINRWKFLLYFILLWAFSSLYLNFMIFFNIESNTSVFIMVFAYIISFLLIFKRFRDINNKLWKAVVYTLVSIIVLIVLFVLLQHNLIYDENNITEKNKIISLLYPLYLYALLLFLLLKNSKDTKFFNLVEIGWKKLLKRIILILSIIFVVRFITFSFINPIFTLIDNRMYPTLEAGDEVLINRITEITSLERGDIVYIKNPDNLSNPLRIIGLPNEEIKLDGNNIYINNELYPDKYAFFSKNLKPINYQETITLDDDSYFLIGDNRYYDKRGEIYIKDRKGNMIWKQIFIYPDTELNNNVYITLKRNELLGKAVAIHYNKYKSGKNNDYSFLIKNKKFGFKPNPLYEEMFGKP